MQSSQVKSSQVRSSQVKSSQVKSSQVKSSQVKSSQVKSSQVKSSQVKSSQVKSSQVKSSQVKPSQAKPSQAKPSQAKPSQAKPSQAKSSQVKSSQVKSSQVKSSQVLWTNSYTQCLNGIKEGGGAGICHTIFNKITEDFFLFLIHEINTQYPPVHLHAIDNCAARLQSTLIECSHACIPRKRAASSKKCVADWNSECSDLRKQSIAWHNMWVQAGWPNTGIIANIMRATRKKYHLVSKQVLRSQNDLRNANIANAHYTSAYDF